MNIEALSTPRGVDFARSFIFSGSCFMVVDESTTIKNHAARRTKNIMKIANLAKYRRIMTGSPVTKSPLDLYSQIQFLGGWFLDQTNYYAFRARYAIIKQRSVGTHSFQHVMGYQRLDELTAILREFSTRILKDDCLDLPEKIYIRREIEMTPEQTKAYRELQKFAAMQIGRRRRDDYTDGTIRIPIESAPQ